MIGLWHNIIMFESIDFLNLDMIDILCLVYSNLCFSGSKYNFLSSEIRKKKSNIKYLSIQNQQNLRIRTKNMQNIKTLVMKKGENRIYIYIDR